MPIKDELLEILCDPVTKTPVQMMSSDTLDRVNQSIARGGVKDADGNTIENALEEGLMTTDGKTIYRVDSGIPIMLAEQGIPTDQIEGL